MIGVKAIGMKNKLLVGLLAGTLFVSASANGYLSNLSFSSYKSRKDEQIKKLDPTLFLTNYEHAKRLYSHSWIEQNAKAIGWDREKAMSIIDSYSDKIDRMTKAIDKARKSCFEIKGERLCSIDPKLPYKDLEAFVALTYLAEARFGVPATMTLAFYMKESHLNLDADGRNGAGGSQITPTGAATVYIQRNMSIINGRLVSADLQPFPELLGNYWDSKLLEFNDTLKIVKPNPWRRNKDFVVDSLGNLMRAEHAPKDVCYDNLFSNNMKNPAISIIYTCVVLISKGFRPTKEGDQIKRTISHQRLKTIAQRYNTVYGDYHKKITSYYSSLKEIDEGYAIE
jgi:hypothetical protein